MKTNIEIKQDSKDPSKIINCSCTSIFQDKTYGLGKRVHTTNSTRGHTCTVCGNFKSSK